MSGRERCVWCGAIYLGEGMWAVVVEMDPDCEHETLPLFDSEEK